jgi:glycosyltransferase involved in cell wall biosynthesis
MKVLFFANKMPDLCGAFLHDVDLAIELQRTGHTVMFLTIRVPREGYNGGIWRGFRFMHYTAARSFMESSDIWVCPHAPILPEVRRINSRGFNRPIVATCHYDGNYTMITGNAGNGWVEMLMFINKIMEPSYKNAIKPWPSAIVRTEVVRPIMHRDNIVITDSFAGEYITLINANQNKGVTQFCDIARKMPDRKFLGVLPYYGEMRLPPNLPSNIKWVPFDNDIRIVLKQTRILLVPSYYESYGRVAVEAMINGIPVLYSKPIKTSIYPGGSTEGMCEWIGDAGIACDREVIDEWTRAIESLDDEAVYADRSELSKTHIDSLDLFTEARRIVGLLESFSRQHPVYRTPEPQSQQARDSREAPRLTNNPQRPVGFGFSNGRLRIQR